jgi:hypothetical protein
MNEMKRKSVIVRVAGRRWIGGDDRRRRGTFARERDRGRFGAGEISRVEGRRGVVTVG